MAVRLRKNDLMCSRSTDCTVVLIKYIPLERAWIDVEVLESGHQPLEFAVCVVYCLGSTDDDGIAELVPPRQFDEIAQYLTASALSCSPSLERTLPLSHPL